MSTEEIKPREILAQHRDDLIVFVEELLSDWLPSEELEEYNDLMWQIKSIEACVGRQGLDEDSVFWVLGEGFKRCPLKRGKDLDGERLCVEVDCPRFNTCELTKGILDKYAL